LGAHDGDFGFEPWPARCDLGRIWLFVNAALASRLPFEVLHGVGDVNFGSVNSRFDERAVKQLSGWSDEWPAIEVFIVPGLFADQYDFGVRRTSAENRLRGIAPQIASAAIAGSILQFRESWIGWNGRAVMILRGGAIFGRSLHYVLMRDDRRSRQARGLVRNDGSRAKARCHPKGVALHNANGMTA
jgi:hypothetical protein